MLAAIVLAAAAAGAAPPTADAVVADYVAARGGLAKIRGIQTLRQRGHARSGAGRDAIVVRELKRPDKSRFEFTTQGVTAAYVVNGTSGWQVSPFEGQLQAEPLSAEAAAEALEQLDIEGPLVDWQAKGHALELAGRESVLGAETYKLKLVLKGGAVRYEYVEVATHRHVRTDLTRTVRGRPVRFEITFSDHREQSGVVFPRTIDIQAVGRPQRLRINVETVEVNPAIDDARFTRGSKGP